MAKALPDNKKKLIDRLFGERTISNGRLLKHTIMKDLMKNREKISKLENDVEIHSKEFKTIPKNSEGKTGDKRIDLTLFAASSYTKSYVYFKVGKKWIRFELS